MSDNPERVKLAMRALEHLEEHGCNIYHWRERETCEWQTRCDEPGCKEQVSCGTPTPTGYRNTCGKHRPKP